MKEACGKSTNLGAGLSLRMRRTPLGDSPGGVSGNRREGWFGGGGNG